MRSDQIPSRPFLVSAGGLPAAAGSGAPSPALLLKLILRPVGLPNPSNSITARAFSPSLSAATTRSTNVFGRRQTIYPWAGRPNADVKEFTPSRMGDCGGSALNSEANRGPDHDTRVTGNKMFPLAVRGSTGCSGEVELMFGLGPSSWVIASPGADVDDCRSNQIAPAIAQTNRATAR